MAGRRQGPAPGAAAAKRRNISEDVADRIFAYIRAAELEPGDRLGRQADLARRFGVSQPTLREALRLLSSAHLIRASQGPGGGIFVAATPEQGIGMSVSAAVAGMLESQAIEMDELIETRLLFEVPLAGLAAQHAGADDVEALEALVDDPEADAEPTAEADARLHRLIAEIAGNRLAGAFTAWVVDVVQPQLRDIIAPAVVEAVIADQHRQLVRAITRGDSVAAERAMREHLVYLRDLLTAVSQE
jgi:GntR family transcriptional regulator, transcriptional repressor for pyruvate dehydrogenase complex